MSLKHNMENCRALPTLDNHKCFGCSPRNTYGLRMKFFTDDNALFSSVTVPDHLCGWDRFVHGGIIATILDEIMSWTAIAMLKRIILTKSMTIDFLKPIFIGNALTVEGRVLKRNSEREALMAGALYNGNGDLCAESEGTFALFTPEAAIRMKIMGREEVGAFENIFNPDISRS
jgi:acyl-coenzyme A thioesterase PaaI-like protein